MRLKPQPEGKLAHPRKHFSMNRQYGEVRFTSSMIEDHAEGFVGYDLIRNRHGKSDRVARIVYWDASGQFSVETHGSDVPLEVLEDLIAEAKARIKVT